MSEEENFKVPHGFHWQKWKTAGFIDRKEKLQSG